MKTTSWPLGKTPHVPPPACDRDGGTVGREAHPASQSYSSDGGRGATHKLLGQSAVLGMLTQEYTSLKSQSQQISSLSTGNRAVCRVPDLCIPHACHNRVDLCLKTLTGFAYVNSHTGLVSGGTSLLECEESFTGGHIWGTP